MKQETRFGYRDLCEAARIPYPSLMRWKSRLSRGESAVRRPGPKKVEPFDLGALEAEVSAFAHCRKRTHGTLELYRRHRDRISRRDLGDMVARARLQANWERRCAVKHLTWHKPCFVWAIDDTEEKATSCGRVFLNAVRDVTSRYELPPGVSGRILDGEKVAAHLEELFKEYPVPLFLKRDNGGNLNDDAVDRVLEKYAVIPLNSPVKYPQYNGSCERGQGEKWTYMRARLPESQASHVRSLAIEAAHMLNHRRRACLGGKTACAVFSAGTEGIAAYDKRKRREVYDWIRDKAVSIMSRTGGDGRRSFKRAWRTACEMWLQANGVLTASVGGRVLRDSSAKTVS